MTKFNAGLAGFIQQTGAAMPVVVKKECGELIKELVKITPPREPDKTRANITNSVYVTMGTLDRGITERQASYNNDSGITWYAWDDRYLYGVASEKDMTGATVADLKNVFLHSKVNRLGGARQILEFTHPRKRQKVALAQRVMTTVKQRQKLIDYFWRHVGRLKAGWLVAVGEHVVTLSGAGLPPTWVTRHIAGARGSVKDNTGNASFPSITIGNRAAGVGNQKNNLQWLVRKALETRVISMARNATLYMSGKKNIGDYR